MSAELQDPHINLQRKQKRRAPSWYDTQDPDFFTLPSKSKRFKISDSGLKHRRSVKRNKNYSQYLMEFWMKVMRMSLFLKFSIVPGFVLGSCVMRSTWAQISKREFLLRLPSMCRKSVDYYSLHIVASRTATFFLKIKKFKPGESACAIDLKFFYILKKLNLN
jgi:hypothetical protein